MTNLFTTVSSIVEQIKTNPTMGLVYINPDQEFDDDGIPESNVVIQVGTVVKLFIYLPLGGDILDDDDNMKQIGKDLFHGTNVKSLYNNKYIFVVDDVNKFINNMETMFKEDETYRPGEDFQVQCKGDKPWLDLDIWDEEFINYISEDFDGSFGNEEVTETIKTIS